MTTVQGERDNNYIQTYKGLFWPLDPRPEDMDIETIAHSLSLQCRFNGHVRRFYSVAQHCVLGARKASSKNRLAFLLHDAAEAYVCDLPRPIKKLVPSYASIEGKIQDVINAQYLTFIDTKEIHEIDNIMLVTEASQLLNPIVEWWKQPNYPEPYNDYIHCWSPIRSKQEFLKAFTEYSKVQL